LPVELVELEVMLLVEVELVVTVHLFQEGKN
jgi:hypothetical protein